MLGRRFFLFSSSFFSVFYFFYSILYKQVFLKKQFFNQIMCENKMILEIIKNSIFQTFFLPINFLHYTIRLLKQSQNKIYLFETRVILTIFSMIVLVLFMLYYIYQISSFIFHQLEAPITPYDMINRKHQK